MAGRGEQLKVGDVPALARLAKLPLAAFIALSTLFGGLVASGKLAPGLLSVALGVLLAASAGASLNSLQERDLDGTMCRTRDRPLPAGKLSPTHALWQAMVLFTVGGLVLRWATEGMGALLLTMVAVFLYNGLYTPLKQRTILAIIPGLASGALPPYIGWIAGGGEPLAFSAMLLVALLVLWQVPHFHLILLANQEDYRHSSLPHLLRDFSETGLRRLFIPWVGALALAMMMFAVLPQPLANPFRLAVIGNALLLLFFFFRRGTVTRTNGYHGLFRILNLSLAVHMAVVAIGRMFATPP